MVSAPGRSSLAILLCLTIGTLLTLTGTGLAISGFASVGPAVQAQYPDATARDPGLKKNGGKRTISLADIRRAARSRQITPAQQAQVAQRTRTALADAGPGLREYGSIPLLVFGIAVFSLGGFLRMRRDAASV